MEALNRDDFPELLADVLGRELLPAYNRRPPSWGMYCKRGTAPNYRPVHRIGINGLSDGLPEVPRGTNVPRRAAQEVAYEHSLKKRSVIVDIALEDLVDDNLDGFAQVPEELANAALWTEDIELARVICDSSGPNATHYNSTNNNIINSNAALNADNLTIAQSQLRSMKDPKGNPIRVLGTVLVVGPGLAEPAARLVSSIQARSTGGGIGSSNTEILGDLFPQNDMAGIIRPSVAVNDGIPEIATTNAATTWFLFSDPNVGRTSVEMIFRNGKPQPRLMYLNPNKASVGGFSAETAPDDRTSFENDVLSYRVTHDLGVGFMEERASVGSDGTG